MTTATFQQPVSNLRNRTVAPITLGVLIVVAAVGGFGWWATSAPISSAAVASGTVGPENSRRAVQHFDGGVVEEIYVQDGQYIEKGEVLLRLDDTAARAALDAQVLLIRTLEAELERLKAERRMLETRDLNLEFRISDQLFDQVAERPAAQVALQLEKSRYEGSRAALRATLDLYEQSVRSYLVQIEGLESQIASISRRRALIHDELVILEDLEERGLEVRRRTAEQRLVLVETEQLLSEREASVASLRESIRLTELQIEELWASKLEETIDAISVFNNELQAALATYDAYEATLDRTVVRSPVDGTLIELMVNTVGGVLRPGETIVEIVPADEAMTMQVRLDPRDIDVVAPGQAATVSLLSYPQRNLRKLYGRVNNVSADILVDPDTGDTYYLAAITVDEAALAELADGIVLVPGMPVEVQISVASRTFLDYLIEPLLTFRDRALKET